MQYHYARLCGALPRQIRCLSLIMYKYIPRTSTTVQCTSPGCIVNILWQHSATFTAGRGCERLSDTHACRQHFPTSMKVHSLVSLFSPILSFFLLTPCAFLRSPILYTILYYYTLLRSKGITYQLRTLFLFPLELQTVLYLYYINSRPVRGRYIHILLYCCLYLYSCLFFSRSPQKIFTRALHAN